MKIFLLIMIFNDSTWEVESQQQMPEYNHCVAEADKFNNDPCNDTKRKRASCRLWIDYE